MEDDPERLVALGQFFGIDRVQFGAQRVGRLKTVGHRVFVGEIFEADLLDAIDANAADAGDKTFLSRSHHPPTPQANRLRLFAATNRREKFLLEKQHVRIVTDSRPDGENQSPLL